MASISNPWDFFQAHSKDVSGSLRVYGDWFGKPNDNWHFLTSFEIVAGHWKLNFNEGETLEIWGADGLKMDGRRLIIQKADRVCWEWFYYGRPKTPENRFFIEHTVVEERIEAESNVTWYSPTFSPSLAEPAVSIG